jgi:hypothetical protein
VNDQLKVREYYRDRQFDGGRNQKQKQKKLPYGLQKKLERGGELPAGWQNKVAKGEVLDGALLERSVRVPEELTRRLPVLRDGSEYRHLGDKVVRVLGGKGTVVADKSWSRVLSLAGLNANGIERLGCCF